MADTVTDVRVVAAAEPGSLARRGERGCAPRLDAGRRPRRRRRRHRGNADRPDHREVLRVDESRNLAWLAIPTWGEAWHNTYHAFPTFSRHRADGREIDLSAQFIELMEKLGIAYDVVRVGPARRARKP
jgi:hypothetical protein